jgi:hypothetical protein
MSADQCHVPLWPETLQARPRVLYMRSSPPPSDLDRRIRKILDKDPTMRWDTAQ